ncbi:FMN-binding protein [Patescibacteria group bacterium]|nr:FMN-binding protein [Patescibacteria group bacterium]
MDRRKASLLLLSLVLMVAVVVSGREFAEQLLTQIRPEQRYISRSLWEREGDVYTTVAIYDTPAGKTSSTFKLTLEDGVISDIDVGIFTKVAAALRLQTDFRETVSSVIVGKKLTEIGKVDRVSGASLTTGAFNEAIARLQEQLDS